MWTVTVVHLLHFLYNCCGVAAVFPHSLIASELTQTPLAFFLCKKLTFPYDVIGGICPIHVVSFDVISVLRLQILYLIRLMVYLVHLLHHDTETQCFGAAMGWNSGNTVQITSWHFSFLNPHIFLVK
jgi:hypothetical protein